MDTILYIGYISAIIVTLGLPLAVAAGVMRRQSSGWRFLLYGAAVYAMVQVVRLPLVRIALELAPGKDSPAFLGVLAISAGVFEEIGRYAGYLFLLRGNLSRPAGIIYGLGHGWAEALALTAGMALTAYLFHSMAQLDLSAVHFTVEQMEIIAQAKSVWFPIAGGFERLAMLPVHVMLSLIVLRSVLHGQRWWLLTAMVIHVSANLVMGLVIRQAGLAYGETIAAVFGLASLLAIKRMRV